MMIKYRKRLFMTFPYNRCLIANRICLTDCHTGFRLIMLILEAYKIWILIYFNHNRLGNNTKNFAESVHLLFTTFMRLFITNPIPLAAYCTGFWLITLILRMYNRCILCYFDHNMLGNIRKKFSQSMHLSFTT